MQIEVLECINCDKCIPACPPQFGAIFHDGIDVIVIPELCSGCLKCLPACPVDCIVSDPQWHTTDRPARWWDLPLSDDDPYVPKEQDA